MLIGQKQSDRNISIWRSLHFTTFRKASALSKAMPLTLRFIRN
ncbi:hypothetical protein [Nostoc sp. ChiVER01]|nr:hypothetical protein [Nostoc sp. ChiVER01]MDZ8225719.1 hypothetical protein [Nostoc sp. ChiVER01]